jgi:hypothetical protein
VVLDHAKRVEGVKAMSLIPIQIMNEVVSSEAEPAPYHSVSWINNLGHPVTIQRVEYAIGFDTLSFVAFGAWVSVGGASFAYYEWDHYVDARGPSSRVFSYGPEGIRVEMEAPVYLGWQSEQYNTPLTRVAIDCCLIVRPELS